MEGKTYCPTCAHKTFDPVKKVCSLCGAAEANGYIPAKKREGRPDTYFERDLDRTGQPVELSKWGRNRNV